MRFDTENNPKIDLEIEFLIFWDPKSCENICVVKKLNFFKRVTQNRSDNLCYSDLQHLSKASKLGIDFGKTRYSLVSTLPCGRPRSQKITISLFVDVAPRAASILKNRDFCIYLVFFKLQKPVIWLDLSLGSMLDSLVLKNAVECTSQRLKWTSGGRVMSIVDACTMIIVHVVL